MITSVEIENLRGIRHGKLEGLGPLTILTGPNGGGKSTVLDALWLVVDPAGGLNGVVERHIPNVRGERWLIHRGASEATVAGQWDDRWLESRLRGAVTVEWEWDGQRVSKTYGPERVTRESQPSGSSTVFLSSLARTTTLGSLPVRLVDPGIPIPLHRLFSAVSKAGHREEVNALLSELVPGFSHLEILTEDDEPVLHIATKEGSVPVSLSGDGIQGFVQVALQTAAAPGSLVLLEEPEVYQHPKAIWQTARALLVNMRRGVQIVLTTHSLELIDALIAEATDEDIEKMVVLNMGLEDGELRYGRRHGEAITFARQTLENDLR